MIFPMTSTLINAYSESHMSVSHPAAKAPKKEKNWDIYLFTIITNGDSWDSIFRFDATFLAWERETIHICYFCSRGTPGPLSSSDPSQQADVKWPPCPWRLYYPMAHSTLSHSLPSPFSGPRATPTSRHRRRAQCCPPLGDMSSPSSLVMV